MRRRLFSLLLICILLAGCSPQTPPATTTPPSTQPASESVSVFTFSAVGDIFITDEMLMDARLPGGAHDFSRQFSGVAAALSTADLTLGNLEGNLVSSGWSQEAARYPESLADTLASCGFDLLQTANSYSISNGLSGLAQTKSLVEQAGMTALGTFYNAEDYASNRVIMRQVNGLRVAIVAFTKGMNSLSLPEGAEHSVNLLYTDYNTNYSKIDYDGINALLAEARDLEPDVIIASLHWGSENNDEISSSQEDLADLLFEGGVDLIVGAHSHLVAPVESRTIEYGGREKTVVVAYSLGDFCAAQEGSNRFSPILNVEFTRDNVTGLTSITDVSFTPVVSADQGPGADPRYVILDADAAAELYESNYYLRISESLYEAILSGRETLAKKLAPREEE